MKPDKKRKAGILKWLIIHLLLIMVLFSNLAPVLLNKIGLNQLAENLKIKEALAVAPIWQASGTAVAGTGAVTAAWPTHQTDDVALLVIETANEAITLGANAADWTQVTNSPQGTGTAGGTAATRLTVFWSRATSAAMGDVGVNDAGNHVRANIYTFRGVITTGNPWDVTAGDVAATASTGVSIPGATTSVVDTLVVAIVANGTDTNTAQCSAWANADLANVVQIAGDNTNVGNGGGTCLATGDKAVAGTYGATTATLVTSSVQGRMSIALKPVPDTSPPTPNPMTFATTPTNDSPTQISATSTTGSDATTPINYFFTLNNTNCGADAGTGGNSSSWQSGVAYSDSGLQPNKCYGYTITARDSVSPTPNTGSTSTASSTYSSANTPGTPILSGATASTLNLTNAETATLLPTRQPTLPCR